jgi:MinD-like ATPase involved in chromosome partitioning or flagellar assembly
MGWRARVFAATGGRLNPGVGATEQAQRDLVRRVRTPLHGPHRVAVTSIKGGIGKTTVAACLGLMLAAIRGDGVIAMDANPDAGTLADRITGTPRRGVRDLLADLDQVTSVSELAAYTSLSGRLRVLAGDQDPAQGEAFRAEEYERVQAVLERFFDIVVTDSGTGLVHSAMQGTLRTADRLVVIGAPTVDGASRAGKTLDWLVAHGHRDLAAQAVLVLCADRTSHGVDRAAIREHFTRRCRDVIEIPADPHLRAGGLIDLDRLTPGARDAFLRLAALVADGFARDPADRRHARGLPVGAVDRATRAPVATPVTVM